MGSCKRLSIVLDEVGEEEGDGGQRPGHRGRAGGPTCLAVKQELYKQWNDMVLLSLTACLVESGVGLEGTGQRTGSSVRRLVE